LSVSYRPKGVRVLVVDQTHFAQSTDKYNAKGHILTRNQVEFLTRLGINKTVIEVRLTAKDVGRFSMF